MREPLSIVVNLAAPYSGYLESGFELPGPLVPVRGMPAYARALGSLPIDLATSITLIVPAAMLDRHDFGGDLRLRFPHLASHIVSSAVAGIGPGGAIRAAIDHLSESGSIIVHPASIIHRSALAARLSVMGELGGLVGVMDGEVIGTGSWSVDSFASVDRTGRVSTIEPRWSQGAMALTGTVMLSGESGATAEAIRLALELDPTSDVSVFLGALVKRWVPLGVDRVNASWDLSHAAGLGAYLAHR